MARKVSYSNGGPGGAGPGPRLAPSRASRFSVIFTISEFFHDFKWNSGFAVNFMGFHVFHADGATFATEWKTLAKRKAWGGFWRSLYREVAHFDEISGFSLHFMKYVKNRDISPKR